MHNGNRLTDSSQRLAEIAEAIWDFRSAREPDLAFYSGAKVSSLPDVSFEDVERKRAFAHDQITNLQQLRSYELSYSELLSRKVLQWDMERMAEEVETWWYRFPVTPYASPLTNTNIVMGMLPFSSAEDGPVHSRTGCGWT